MSVVAQRLTGPSSTSTDLLENISQRGVIFVSSDENEGCAVCQLCAEGESKERFACAAIVP